MARATLTAQTPARTGTTITFAAVDAANGDQFANNGRRLLRFKNTAGSAVTVTVSIGATVDGSSAAGKTITVPATTGDVTTGVYPTYPYNQSNGFVYLDYSSGTNVTVAVIDV